MPSNNSDLPGASYFSSTNFSGVWVDGGINKTRFIVEGETALPNPDITSDGGGDTAAIDVVENTTAVTDVQATDDSDSEGSGLTYSLTGGADQGSFSIDGTTGVLTFVAAPRQRRPD